MISVNINNKIIKTMMKNTYQLSNSDSLLREAQGKYIYDRVKVRFLNASVMLFRKYSVCETNAYRSK